MTATDTRTHTPTLRCPPPTPALTPTPSRARRTVATGTTARRRRPVPAPRAPPWSCSGGSSPGSSADRASGPAVGPRRRPAGAPAGVEQLGVAEASAGTRGGPASGGPRPAAVTLVVAGDAGAVAAGRRAPFPAGVLRDEVQHAAGGQTGA